MTTMFKYGAMTMMVGTIAFICPYCHQPIRTQDRLGYPRESIGFFSSVYRCRCGKHIGEPVTRQNECLTNQKT